MILLPAKPAPKPGPARASGGLPAPGRVVLQTAEGTHAAAPAPKDCYGCVDWFIYPVGTPEQRGTGGRGSAKGG